MVMVEIRGKNTKYIYQMYITALLLLTKVHSLHLHFTLYVVHFFGFDK